MRKNLIKAAKASGVALGGALLVAGWLKLHSDFRKFPQGKFWDPPSKTELPGNSAAGNREKQAVFDSLKPKPDTLNKK